MLNRGYLLFFYGFVFMLISFCDISCVNGYNTDDESRILGPCRLYCEISDLVPNIDSPFCDRRCLVDQCNNGCSMYHMAVSNWPCLSVCDNWMRENQTDVGRSPNSVIQLKVQTCTRGCGIGLEEFYKSAVGITRTKLPKANVVKDGITHNSVLLSWPKADWEGNMTFQLQVRIVDTDSDWQNYKDYIVLQSGNINVTNLLPFITYQFKRIFHITTVHSLETNESSAVMTLPFGAPSSAPTVTSLIALSPNTISVSWLPPIYTNGPLLSYRLSLMPLAGDGHMISTDVPEDKNSWIFGHLLSGRDYEVTVSAVNSAGEGPAYSKSVTTPIPGNLSMKETPYLVLGAENYVVKQRLLELLTRDYEKIVTKPKSILVTGIGVHTGLEIVLIADDSGRVTMVDINGTLLDSDMYRGAYLSQPTSIDVDWLHNYSYVADGHRIYKCALLQPFSCDIALEIMPYSPKVLKVDPLSGYLYYSIYNHTSKKGLFRIDLADAGKHGEPYPTHLINADISGFAIDYENLLIYYPNSTHNTIMSAFLDGSSVSDTRKGTVARPHFLNIESLVKYDGKYVWTNGTRMFSEEYDAGNGTYYHHSLALLERHLTAFNLYFPNSQPVPVPLSPPRDVQVLFTSNQAYVTWQVTQKLNYQGQGAFNQWNYEVAVLNKQGNVIQSIEASKGLSLNVPDLNPNTDYRVKVRAKSRAGNGPWSATFLGKTLKQADSDSAYLIVAVKHQLQEVALNGVVGKTIVDTWPIYPGVADLAWYEDKVFWTSNDGDIFMHRRDTTEKPSKLDFARDARCVAFDWLGLRLYWSEYRNAQIKRAEINGNNVQFIYWAQARHMALDSLEGRLYWVSMTSVESTTLNGDDHLEYFGLEPFSSYQIISLTIDQDMKKIVWYVKGFEDQSLYVGDLVTSSNQGNHEAIIKSVTMLGKLYDIDRYSVLQHFSHRLVWIDASERVRIGDPLANSSAAISTTKLPVAMVTLVHHTLQPYPAGLNSYTVRVIPQSIRPGSVSCQGEWSHFNVTWQPATEVNHGKVRYELSIETEGRPKSFQVVNDSWFEVSGLAPYSALVVSLQAFTVWGTGNRIVTTVWSPMSIPGQPVGPKVYVTQRKNDAASRQTLAADFRWMEPTTMNGVLSSQNVYYWKSSDPTAVTTASLSSSARHYVLADLMNNITYYFQVECCTKVGCGPRSAIVNATTDAVNPVPRLLIASTTGVIEAEADNVLNTSVIVTTKHVTALAHLSQAHMSQDDAFFWITRERNLERLPSKDNRKLLHIEGEASPITLDWVSRSLYVAHSNQSNSAILRYNIDQGTYETVIEGTSQIVDMVVDPFTSSLIWTERISRQGTLFKSNTNNLSHVQPFFTNTIRQKRTTNSPCTCLKSPWASSKGAGVTIAMDLSNDGHTELIFVDAENLRLMAASLDGCHCRVLLNTTETDRKGLPPDHMTVDHVYIYWYQASTSTLYIMDKETGTIKTTPLDHVTDILAFESHLQPLPGSECLDTAPYSDKVNVVSVTNTSIGLRLHDVVWPEACANISHPAVKYWVFYRELDEMNPSADCSNTGSACMNQSSYDSSIAVSGLQPYRPYVLQGSVSTFYSQYSVGDRTNVMTHPGVPSPVENIRALPQSPNSVSVSWLPPAQPNGPMEGIMYFIRWSAILQDGTRHMKMSDAMTHNASQLESCASLRYCETIDNLLADQAYSIQVISNQTSGNFVTESEPVPVRTFEQPTDIEMLDVTNTSIHVSWRFPVDFYSVRLVYIFYEQVTDIMPGKHYSKQQFDIITENNTLYNQSFVGLKPNTEYAFQLRIIYRDMFDIYYWPNTATDVKYAFKTLTGIPGPPEPPTVQEFRAREFEIIWMKPDDNGEPIEHYILQYKLIDKENWSIACNMTDTRWVIDEGVLQRGYTYMFRVQAQNKKGWGPSSLNSTPFSYPMLEVEQEGDMVTVVAVVSAIISVVIGMSVIAVCYSVCRRRREEKKKDSDFMAVTRGPDLELATLRELPMTAIQQNNTLYAMSIVPTDDEIAALPHFRRDQLVLCKFLGSGAFGEVFEGVAKNILNESSGDTRCAVKTLRKSASDQEKDEFLKEALLMSNFHHEHILGLLGVCLDNDPQFIILELMEGGDLLSFLRACRLSSIQQQSRVELSLMDLVKICVHVASGCKYLQDMRFVHRDLAARNCLVSSLNLSNMVVKIGDFGLARDIYKNDYYRKEGEGLLPVRWMSPESLVDGVFTTHSDIWAFGVLMWEVVTFGQQPYPARTNMEVLHFVRGSGRLDRPDNCPEDFYQLMCKCWSFDPLERPSFAYLLQQLQKFHETCQSVSEYLLPISSNRTFAQAAGSTYLSMRQRRLMSSQSDGPEYRSINHVGYSSHNSYGKIHRATSFDTPEPKDATDQIQIDAANYLEPKSCHAPHYIEFLPDHQTANYVYDADGNRLRSEGSKSELSANTTGIIKKGPNYVQTTVKENFQVYSSNYGKFVNQKESSSTMDVENDSEVKQIFAHQKNSADSVIMKSMEIVNLGRESAQSSIIQCSNTLNSQILNAPPGISNLSNRSFVRKQRLDSSNSIKSFDSVQTEPAYATYNRGKLYSTSSSRSNYSMSNISESAVEQISPISIPEIIPDPVAQQFWVNNARDCDNLKTKNPDLLEYLNMVSRSQIYPENAGPLAGYDIVNASLV